MTTSTNDKDDNGKTMNKKQKPAAANDRADTVSDTVSGAIADALTMVRLVLTPIIMFIIYKAWSPQTVNGEGIASININLALLAVVLFLIAAFTDILDDYFGGSAISAQRHFGWFDDIADSVLIGGSLLALGWALANAKMLHWSFAIPAAILIGRDIIIGLKKGYEISKFGFLETRLGDIKSALAVLAALVLLSSPWLDNIVNGFRARAGDNLMEIYGQSSSLVWNIGLVLLWIAALLALWTGYQILSTDFAKMAKEQEKQQEKQQEI